jgi:hypothetical protein
MIGASRASAQREHTLIVRSSNAPTTAASS